MTTFYTPEEEKKNEERKMSELERRIELWLYVSDWDYKKYDDRRVGREAYSTMMRYEISDLLAWAYTEGFQHAIEDCAQIASNGAQEPNAVVSARAQAHLIELAIRKLAEAPKEEEG